MAGLRKSLAQQVSPHMTDQRFPYEQSQWESDSETKRRWYDALERTGTEVVRARLARSGAGPADCTAIGTELAMTIGFAEEWLAWHDRQKSERETKVPFK
jgi:hypothetical protein